MRKANMGLNGEWGKHVKRDVKKSTNKKRRQQGKREIKERN